MDSSLQYNKCLQMPCHRERLTKSRGEISSYSASNKDKPCEELLDKSLQGKIVSEMTGIEANCSVERRGLSQYEISYNPIIKRQHHLYVTVRSQHVRGSQGSTVIQSQIQNLGTPILTIGRGWQSTTRGS